MRDPVIDVASDNRANQILSTLAGAGLASAGAALSSRRRDGEDKEEYKSRRRRNTLLAAALGGGAGLGHATLFPDRSVTLRQIMESNYDSPEQFQEALDKAREFREQVGDPNKWLQSLDEDHLNRRYLVHDVSGINTRPNRGTRLGQKIEDALGRRSRLLRDAVTMPLTDRVRSIRSNLAAPYFDSDPGAHVGGFVIPGVPGRIAYNQRVMDRVARRRRESGRQHARSVLGHEAMHRLQVAGLERRPARLGGTAVHFEDPWKDALAYPRFNFSPVPGFNEYMSYLANPFETEVRLPTKGIGQRDLRLLRRHLRRHRFNPRIRPILERLERARELSPGLVGYRDDREFLKRSFTVNSRRRSFERMADPVRGSVSSLVAPPAAFLGGSVVAPGAPMLSLSLAGVGEGKIGDFIRYGLDKEDREKARMEALESVKEQRVKRRQAVLGHLLGGLGWGAALSPLLYAAEGLNTNRTPSAGRALGSSAILGLALGAPGALLAATANKEDLSMSAAKELEKRRAKLKQEREDGDKED